MCAGNCPDTDTDGNGNGGGDDELTIEAPDIPPACQGNLAQCNAVLEAVNKSQFNITREGCAPGDTNCQQTETKTETNCAPGDTSCKNSPPIPPIPSEIMTQGLITSIFAAPEFHSLGDSPNGGTSSGSKTPVIPQRLLDYGDLTPAQKSEVDKFMGPLNAKNKKWLAAREKRNAMGSLSGKSLGGKSLSGNKRGKSASGSGNISGGNTIGVGGSGLGGEDDTGDDLSAGQSSGSGSHSAFAGGDSRSVSSLEPDDLSTVRTRKKNALAEQMKKMLKNFYGGDGSGNNPIAEKSVQFGDDIVGVPEDNIFMMVHRRHRSLDTRKRFIGDTF